MLPMREYLAAVEEFGIEAAGVLAMRHHPKVVLRKAEKASDKGYVDFGTSPWRTWLEPRGVEFLRANRE